MRLQYSSRNNYGFVAAIALFVLCVAAVAAIAFFVIHSQHNSTSDASTQSNPKQTSDQNGADAAKNQTKCLSLAALRAYAYQPIRKIAKSTQIARAYFGPDSTEYNLKLMPRNKLVGADAYALYQETIDKEYQFTITASTSEASASESGQQLAAARAEKVKGELVARGIPVERITVLPPTHGLAGGDLTRYVYINVSVPEACVTN